MLPKEKRDTNKEELKIKIDLTFQWFHFAMASLYNGATSLCNGYVAFKSTIFYK